MTPILHNGLIFEGIWRLSVFIVIWKTLNTFQVIEFDLRNFKYWKN